MKILLLNQTFYPDVVSTAQHLTDLAVALAEGLLREFPAVASARVRVRKLKPPIPERLSSVGVEVRLSRADLKT